MKRVRLEARPLVHAQPFSLSGRLSPAPFEPR